MSATLRQIAERLNLGTSQAQAYCDQVRVYLDPDPDDAIILETLTRWKGLQAGPQYLAKLISQADEAFTFKPDAAPPAAAPVVKPQLRRAPVSKTSRPAALTTSGRPSRAEQERQIAPFMPGDGTARLKNAKAFLDDLYRIFPRTENAKWKVIYNAIRTAHRNETLNVDAVWAEVRKHLYGYRGSSLLG
ncbi:MAG TPA: hypothetical protein VLS48_04355 [Anaerolineales bacterium]|nr:hypothetical protein [Anaerolineales bacterium]